MSLRWSGSDVRKLTILPSPSAGIRRWGCAAVAFCGKCRACAAAAVGGLKALPPLLFEDEPTRRANRALAHLPPPRPCASDSSIGRRRVSCGCRSVLQSCVADVHHMSAPRSDRTSFDVSRTPTKPHRRPIPKGSDITKGSSRLALQFARELICCSRGKLRGVVRRREKWQAGDPCLWRWQSVRSY
jgi:hypothetical protein